MFSNGTEATIWIERNCRRCRRYDDDSMENTKCDFATTIELGFFTGVTDDMKALAPAFNCNGDPATTCSQIVLRESV